MCVRFSSVQEFLFLHSSPPWGPLSYLCSAHIDRTCILERCAEHLVHLLLYTPSHSRNRPSDSVRRVHTDALQLHRSHALKQPSHVVFHYVNTAKEVVIALWLRRRARCLLKLHMKNASTSMRLFSLEMRGPLTAHRPHSPVLCNSCHMQGQLLWKL